MEYYSEEIKLGLVFFGFVIFGFLSNTIIMSFIRSHKSYWKYIYIIGMIICLLILCGVLNYFLGEYWFIAALTLFVFAQLVLFSSHFLWHKLNSSTNQVLNDKFKTSEQFKLMWSAWKDTNYSFCTDQYLIDIRPFAVRKIGWDKIYEIEGEEQETYVIPATILYFWYGKNQYFAINDTCENFNDIAKMMQKNFPSIPKEWPNHVFNAEGRIIKLYSYENQVY